MSLFQLCLKFICNHLDNLDSLVGFPESIGRIIFDTAYESDGVSRPGSATDGFSKTCGKTKSGFAFRYTLQVFFEAYGDSGILPSLSLRDDAVFLNDTLDDCWWLYQHLSQLDLTFCGLGDAHDILPQILTSTQHLQTLILKGNSLTDEGVRKLTIRIRMHTELQSSTALEVLDLSENHGIKVKSLEFLECLPLLAVLDVSGTGISKQQVARKHHTAQWNVLSTDAVNRSICNCVRSRLTVTTSGWGSRPVECWKAQAAQARHERLQAGHSPQAKLGPGLNLDFQTFYSRKKSCREERTVPRNNVDQDFLKPRLKELVLVSTDLFSCQHINADTSSSSSMRNTASLTDSKLNKTERSVNTNQTTSNRMHQLKTKQNCLSHSKFRPHKSPTFPCKEADVGMEGRKQLRGVKRICGAVTHLKKYPLQAESVTAEADELLSLYTQSKSGASPLKKKHKQSILDVLGEYT